MKNNEPNGFQLILRRKRRNVQLSRLEEITWFFQHKKIECKFFKFAVESSEEENLKKNHWKVEREINSKLIEMRNRFSYSQCSREEGSLNVKSAFILLEIVNIVMWRRHSEKSILFYLLINTRELFYLLQNRHPNSERPALTVLVDKQTCKYQKS